MVLTTKVPTQDADEPAPVQTGRAFNRSRWVWFLASFALVVVVMELGARKVGPITTQIPIIFEQHRDALATDGDTYEIVFSGDSTMGADLNPVLFTDLDGRPGYNLWMPTASLVNLEPVLLEFGIREDTSPDVVVIGVTGRMFNETVRSGRETLQDQVSSSLPWRSRVSSSRLVTVEQRVSERLSLVRYRAELRKPTNWIDGLRGGGTQVELINNGQLSVFLDGHHSELTEAYEAGERAALVGYELSEADFDALDRVISTLTESGVKVYVVNMPTYNELFDDYYPNGSADVAKFQAELQERMSSQPAVLIDMTDLGANGEFFTDGNHMNRTGSEAFTRALAEAISRDGQ